MITKLDLLLAWRYLRAKREDGYISFIAIFSLIGITLGVATLIIVMSVMNGFRTELQTRILGLNGHIEVAGISGDLNNYNTLTQQLLNNPNITQAAPVIIGQVMAASTNKKVNPQGVLLRGMRYEDLSNKQIIAGNIKAGALGSNYQNQIIIGSKLARNLQVGVGDSISLIAPASDSTIFGSIPKKKTLKIGAIFEIGMHEFDASTLFIDMAMAQKILKMSGKVSGVELMVNDLRQSDIIASDLRKSLRGPYYVTDWKRKNKHIFSALQTERNVMFLILSLIILIASFNILTTLVMLVKEKTRQIAILRTMGATRATVLKVFILVGSFTGILGTFLGFALGTAFALNIQNIREFLEGLMGGNLFPSEVYFLSKLPAEVNNSEVLLVVLVSLGIAFLATIYPALRASKLEPASALKYE